MDVSEIIKTALQPLNLPVSPGKYTGAATEYIIYDYLDERPEHSADDTDLLDVTYVRVSQYTKANPEAKKKTIRRLMRASGFYVYNTQQIYENDTECWHVFVEAWIEGFIND